MNTNKKLTAALTALVIAILACNLPAQKPGADATPTLPNEPTQTPTPATTPTPSTPTVSVSTATNCRTGPGPNYDLVLVFQPGATAPVVAKYTPSNYWIITTPTGGTCWLWGAYATVQGDTSTLAEMAAPAAPATQVASNSNSNSNPQAKPSPTPTTKPLVIGPIINPGVIKIALPPAEPSNLTVNSSCQYIYFPVKQLIGRTDTLTWTSVSNATGYIVYMNGSQITKVTGTSYQVNYPLSQSATSYGVAAYNSFGTSATKSASAPGC